MSKIIVAGSINMDVVAQVKQHPRPGETVFSTGLSYVTGGKGANQAVAASRLGGDVHMVGKLGKDGFGDTLRAFLSSENMNLDNVGVSETELTGVALITVDEGSENSIIVTSGSNFDLNANDVLQVPINEGDYCTEPCTSRCVPRGIAALS